MEAIPTFQLVKQPRKFSHPWALFVSFDFNQRCVIERWESRPSEEEILSTTRLFTRSIEIFIDHLNRKKLRIGYGQWLVEDMER